VLLEQDDPKTATGSDPEALIEEARQLQRQRTRRRTIVLQIAAVLIILGVGVNHFARGGSSASTAPQQPPISAVRTPTVTYKNVVSQRFVPHLPVETYTWQIWSSSATPDVVRAIVTNAVGSGLVSPPPPPSGQILKQVLATPFARVEGMRTYEGRSVYVVITHDLQSTKQTLYLDKRTHEIVRSDLVAIDLRVLDRRIQQKTLPATRANLALTNLPAAHPHARIAREETPRIQRLVREAFDIDNDASFEMIMR
jgi:hypothetical protein